jgi:hypothetical protein
MNWIFLAFMGGTSLIVGWYSVQSLLQARLLRRWRHATPAGVAGRAVALNGAVRVHRVLRVAHIGDILWHREIVKVKQGKTERTESDTADIADFSIAVGGDEVWLAEHPTEVQGAASKTTSDEWGLDNLLTGRQRVIDQWMPIVEELTIVGKVRRGDRRWELVRDAKVGLYMTRHHPSKAALNEAVKGWAGLAMSLALGATAIYFAGSLR